MCERKAGKGNVSRSGNNPIAESFEFRFAVGVEILDDEFNAPFLDVEDFVPMVKKSDLKLELFPF